MARLIRSPLRELAAMSSPDSGAVPPQADAFIAIQQTLAGDVALLQGIGVRDNDLAEFSRGNRHAGFGE